jgi:uncharacterized surface protein with fasciclin (FAS1) repeats
MKNKLYSVLFVMCLMASFALAQVDQDPGTVTNDQTQARLRVAHLVFGGPNIDLLVNGEIPVNRDVVQANFPAGYIGGYLYLEPGTYTVAVVPTSKGIDEALIGPQEVTLEAGHRYTLAMMGQMADESFTPLLMDDTVLLQKARTSPEQSIMILVNNLAGTETLDFTLGGQGPTGVPYGSFAAAPIALAVGEPLRIVTNVGVIGEEAGPGADPAMDFTVAFMGRFPSQAFHDTQSLNTSDLFIVAFLREFSGLGFEWAGHPISFDTFLSALETTGLIEMLETGGPYLVFPPTDEAFATLPQDQLDALMANPEALTDLVRYHIVEGYYPRGALITGEKGRPKVLTNLLGMELELIPGMEIGETAPNTTINGSVVSDLQHYFVANGTHIFPVTTVLLPPEN